MTGYYVRVLRDQRWQNLEIDELSDDELASLHMAPTLGREFAVALARWIRDNVRDPGEPALEPEEEPDDG